MAQGLPGLRARMPGSGTWHRGHSGDAETAWVAPGDGGVWYLPKGQSSYQRLPGLREEKPGSGIWRRSRPVVLGAAHVMHRPRRWYREFWRGARIPRCLVHGAGAAKEVQGLPGSRT